MPTVYQRICNFEQRHKFRFNQRGKLNVGTEIKKAWETSKESDKFIFKELRKEGSAEPEGIFQVFIYPDIFTAKMDEIIASYVKRIIEKPRKSSTNSISLPISTEKKERKRKPIQPPAFSGKDLKKK